MCVVVGWGENQTENYPVTCSTEHLCICMRVWGKRHNVIDMIISFIVHRTTFARGKLFLENTFLIHDPIRCVYFQCLVLTLARATHKDNKGVNETLSSWNPSSADPEDEDDEEVQVSEVPNRN